MISFGIFPSINGYYLFLGFHVVLACVGAYFYGRVLGMRPIASAMVALAFGMGNFTERIACCTIHVQVAAWFPAILVSIELALRATTWRRKGFWLILAGIGLGQMMAGWIGQGAYYAGLAVGAYALFRLTIDRPGSWSWSRQIKQVVVGCGVIGVIELATVAPAVVPRIDTISRSNLANLYDTGSGTASTGWTLMRFPVETLSYVSGTGTTYLGMVLVSLVLIGAAIGIRRPRTAYFVVYAIVVTGLIVRNSPFLTAFNYLPRFQSLHAHSPDRVYTVLYLAFAVLAGWVIDAIVTDRQVSRPRWPIVLGATVFSLAVIGVADWAVDSEVSTWIRSDFLVAGIEAALVACLGLLVRFRWLKYLAALLLIALVVWDPSGNRIMTRERRPVSTARLGQLVDGYLDPSPAAQWLQARRDAGEIFRFYGYDQAQLMEDGQPGTYHISYSSSDTYRLLVNNRGVAFGLDDIQGYNPVQIQRYVEYFDGINGVAQSYHAANVLASGLDSPLIRMLGVKYIVVPVEIPAGRPDLLHLSQRYPTVYSDESVRILEMPDPLARAWIVHQSDTAEDADEILTRFSLQLEDPERTVLVVGDAPELEAAPSGSTENVTVTSYSGDEIGSTVNAASTGMVVLSEIWDPGWSATVDGKPVKIWEADGAFRGVVVSEGTHEIVVKYKATLARTSLLAWLIPVFALLGLCIPVRRRPMADEPVPGWTPDGSVSG